MTWAGMAVALAAAALSLAGCGDGGSDDPAEDGPLPTVFVGDSITLGVSPEDFTPDDSYSWVEYVGSEPGNPWRPLAVSAEFGRTLIDMQARFDDEVLADDPEGVVIMGGTNDALRALPVEPSMDALRSMVTAAEETGAEVWIVAPPPLDPAFGRDLGSFVTAEAALAEEVGVPFVDVRADLSAADGDWQEGLASDGVHPSQEGARRIAALVVAAVAQ